MSFDRAGRLVALLCIVLALPSCTKEGDTITYENPTASPPASGSIVAVTSSNILVNVSPSAPTTVLSAIPIQGLVSGENFVGIDYRPATKVLYGWTSGGRLYTIDTVTGVALQVGSTALIIFGGLFGFDFSPVADRIRIVTDQDFNRRVDPTDGSSVGDVGLAYAAGDAHAGTDPYVTALAYSNNVAGAASTTLYGIDQSNGDLVTVNPPNNGTLNTVGSLGVTTYAGTLCFDIAPNGIAYAAIVATGNIVKLHTINLTTGAATVIGTLGTGTAFGGMAVVP